MEIKGKIYCFFEQSGTFKNEFRKLGYEAEDYDIQNEYGETDHICDLFAEIERGYDGKPSIFDEITPDDLVLAFFPCIYFETIQQLYFSLEKNDLQKFPKTKQIEYAMDRLAKRTYFHNLLYKFVHIILSQKIRLIIENPATTPNYLISGQNFPPPTFIDKNRWLRGDYFKKPTAYWFFNSEPTSGTSYQRPKEFRNVQKSARSKGDGVCSKERSEISPDYARNFICDFIIGKVQPNTLPTLF